MLVIVASVLVFAAIVSFVIGLSWRNEGAMDSRMANLRGEQSQSTYRVAVGRLMIQQSTGGNLSEILDNVAHTMRERTRIRGEIKTLTSQQMLTGIVIGGLPIIMVGLFSLINPEYMKPIFTETAGHVMLAGAGILEFFGILLIRRILAIEV